MKRSEAIRLYKLEYLPSAQRDMVEIVRYIARDLGNPQAALRLSDEFDAAVNILSEYPYACPPYHPIRLLSHEYRKLIVRNYIMLYWVSEETRTVTIMRVVYAPSDYERLLT